MRSAIIPASAGMMAQATNPARLSRQFLNQTITRREKVSQRPLAVSQM
jgi:hypothetical protein